MEAFVSRHPRDAKKLSVIGSGHLFTRVVRETIAHLREPAQLTINTGNAKIPSNDIFIYLYLFICFSHDNSDNCMYVYSTV